MKSRKIAARQDVDCAVALLDRKSTAAALNGFNPTYFSQ